MELRGRLSRGRGQVGKGGVDGVEGGRGRREGA
jgi:hypothetical protein